MPTLGCRWNGGGDNGTQALSVLFVFLLTLGPRPGKYELGYISVPSAPGIACEATVTVPCTVMWPTTRRNRPWSQFDDCLLFLGKVIGHAVLLSGSVACVNLAFYTLWASLNVTAVIRETKWAGSSNQPTLFDYSAGFPYICCACTEYV